MKQSRPAVHSQSQNDQAPSTQEAVPAPANGSAFAQPSQEWIHQPRPQLPPIPYFVRNHEPNLQEFEIF